jgi:hypothetical protein
MSSPLTGKIMSVPLPTGTCRRCGCELPKDFSDQFLTCEDWMKLMMPKLPRPCPLQLLLSLYQQGMLCRLIGKADNDSALLSESIKEFGPVCRG